jgi:hypothetical protein
MADVSKKMAVIIDMIEKGYYFTINRARQKGKTTIHELLSNELSDKYMVISASFEGRSSLFEGEHSFTSRIFDVFVEPFEVVKPRTAERIKSYRENLKIFISCYLNSIPSISLYNCRACFRRRQSRF